MKLYRESGVNPLGGCLPVLLQYPFLIAMYAEIRRSGRAVPVETRADARLRWSRTTISRRTASLFADVVTHENTGLPVA